jgi:hypothetical protein
MAVEELAIQRLGEKFWRTAEEVGRFFFGESMLLKRTKADCARRSQRCVD